MMMTSDMEATVTNLLPEALMTAYTEEAGDMLMLVIEGPDAPKHRMPLHFAGFHPSDDQTRWESGLFSPSGDGFDRIVARLRKAKFRA